MNSRLLLLCSFAVLSLCTVAQSAEFTFLRATTPVDRTALKFVIEELRSVDPNAAVFLSDDGTILQVKHGAASLESYRTAIEAAGVVLEPGTVSSASLQQSPGESVPVYVVTGNELEDRARYDAAVEAWNAAHPEAPVGAPLHTIEHK